VIFYIQYKPATDYKRLNSTAIHNIITIYRLIKHSMVLLNVWATNSNCHK